MGSKPRAASRHRDRLNVACLGAWLYGLELACSGAIFADEPVAIGDLLLGDQSIFEQLRPLREAGGEAVLAAERQPAIRLGEINAQRAMLQR